MNNNEDLQLINKIKTNKQISKDDLGYHDPNEDNEDVISFCDYVEPPKDCLKTFIFDDDGNCIDESETSPNIIPDNRINSGVKSKTPPIDDEPLDIRRGYSLRRSTVLMLQELKFLHPDINIYMNSIVDSAIRHYYDYIKNQGGSQR